MDSGLSVLQAHYANKSIREKQVSDKKILGMPTWLFEIVISVAAFIFIFLAYMIVKPLNGINSTKDGAFAKGLGFILLAGLAVAAILLGIHKKLNFRNTVILLLTLGFILRLTYMLYTAWTSRQYDTTGTSGHYAYALAFYQTYRLPTENITPDTIYQFYHPPFNASIQGFFMHVFETFCWNSELKETTEDLYQSCQILACFYMYLTSLFFAKTIIRTRLSGKAKLLGIAFVALFPRLIQFSGQLNNDGLSVLFSALALYYFSKWYFEKKSWLNNMLTALFIGLALYAKMSVVSICLGMAVGYVIELVRSFMKKKDALPVKDIILQYVAFLAVAAVIGLWWQLYTHYVYGLPFNFVFKNLNSNLYTGSQNWIITHRDESWIDYYDNHNLENGLIYTSSFYNFIARYIFPFYIPDFSYGTFCSAFNNYNILSYALRSSMFGEFNYWYGTAQGISLLCVIAIYVAWFALIVSIIYCAVKCIIKKQDFGKDTLMAIYLAVGMIIMYLYLQITMPYGCSMDFRYIVPIILPIGFLIGKTYDMMGEFKSKVGTCIQKTLSISTLILLGSTSIFYLSAI